MNCKRLSYVDDWYDLYDEIRNKNNKEREEFRKIKRAMNLLDELKEENIDFEITVRMPHKCVTLRNY